VRAVHAVLRSVSGDRFIKLFDRGAGEQVSISLERTSLSFSGNCGPDRPVGTHRRRTASWLARSSLVGRYDLSALRAGATSDSTCVVAVVRQLARDNLG
jgi:hypothetical protein